MLTFDYFSRVVELERELLSSSIGNVEGLLNNSLQGLANENVGLEVQLDFRKHLSSLLLSVLIEERFDGRICTPEQLEICRRAREILRYTL